MISGLLFIVFCNIRVTADHGNYLSPPPVIVKNIGKTNSFIPEGTYEIISELNFNKVLDISEAATEQGARLQLYDKNDTDAQKFNISYNKDGFYTIKARCSGKMIDVPGASKE